MKRRQFLAQSPAAAAAMFAWTSTGAMAEKVGADQLRAFAKAIRGQLVLPGHPRYDSLRQVQAAKVDALPAAIAMCKSVDDVRRCVDFARQHGLELAVRGGGHSVAGHGTSNGLLIDLRGLNTVGVDAHQRTAHVGGGVLLGRIDSVTKAHGLATVLGECPTVGVGGFALGGGEGMLMGKYGVACDNILSAELVLSDGSLVTASERRHPDLYWAIRGGGGNFGVATRLLFALHPVNLVYAGNIVLSADHPGEFLRHYRDFCAQAPEELTTILRLIRQANGELVFFLRVCHCGDMAQAPKAVQPLRTMAKVLRDSVKPIAYADLQASGPADSTPVFDETRSGFIPVLSDHLINTLVDQAQAFRLPFTLALAHLHGAVSAPTKPSAYPLRRPGFDLWISSEWQKPEEGENVRASIREAWRQVSPFTQGAYVNGLEDEGAERVRAAYGTNFQRLQIVKRVYDPQNIFRRNQNISPY